MSEKKEESMNISQRGILCPKCMKRNIMVKMYVETTVPFTSGYVRYRKCKLCKETKKTVET